MTPNQDPSTTSPAAGSWSNENVQPLPRLTYEPPPVVYVREKLWRRIVAGLLSAALITGIMNFWGGREIVAWGCRIVLIVLRKDRMPISIPHPIGLPIPKPPFPLPQPKTPEQIEREKAEKLEREHKRDGEERDVLTGRAQKVSLVVDPAWTTPRFRHEVETAERTVAARKAAADKEAAIARKEAEKEEAERKKRYTIRRNELLGRAGLCKLKVDESWDNEELEEEVEAREEEKRIWMKEHGNNAQCPRCHLGMRLTKTNTKASLICTRCKHIFWKQQALTMGPPAPPMQFKLPSLTKMFGGK